jgi:RNA polymerase sigma factor (sigma-70 family)
VKFFDRRRRIPSLSPPPARPLIRTHFRRTLALMEIVQPLDIPEHDDDLVARIISSQESGDRDETRRLVEMLYRKHSRAIYARLTSLASWSQVDDLAQDTWIRILEKLRLYKVGNFRAWALTIARHQFLDWARARRPSLSTSEVDVADHSPDRDEERSTRSERARILRDCLAKLNDRHRNVVMGIAYEQSDYKSLCLKLGISANEAYKLKHEAKELLADCCQRANR